MFNVLYCFHEQPYMLFLASPRNCAGFLLAPTTWLHVPHEHVGHAHLEVGKTILFFYRKNHPYWCHARYVTLFSTEEQWLELINEQKTIFPYKSSYMNTCKNMLQPIEKTIIFLIFFSNNKRKHIFIPLRNEKTLHLSYLLPLVTTVSFPHKKNPLLPM